MTNDQDKKPCPTCGKQRQLPSRRILCVSCGTFVCEECGRKDSQMGHTCPKCANEIRECLNNPRTCHHCQSTINFVHAFEQNKDFRLLTHSQFFKAWNSKHVQFLCCGCFAGRDALYPQLSELDLAQAKEIIEDYLEHSINYEVSVLGRSHEYGETTIGEIERAFKFLCFKGFFE